MTTARKLRSPRPSPRFPKQRIPRPGREREMKPVPRHAAPGYHGSGKLKNKVALITGADSGIGRSVAILFAREGADIAIVYLNEHEDAEEARRDVEKEGRRAILIPGDVSDHRFCRRAVQETVRKLGKLDVLVNNAAYEEHAESIEELTPQRLDRTFKTNIYGYFYMVQAALPHLSKGSAIINTGSITGFRGNAELLDYSATKGAIHTFTKALAQNLVKKGIRVNAVAPGPVWTPLVVADFEPGDVSKFGEDTPMKRPAQPEEIAPAYVYFASEADSSYVTGDVLPILGGEIVG